MLCFAGGKPCLAVEKLADELEELDMSHLETVLDRVDEFAQRSTYSSLSGDSLAGKKFLAKTLLIGFEPSFKMLSLSQQICTQTHYQDEYCRNESAGKLSEGLQQICGA